MFRIMKEIIATLGVGFAVIELQTTQIVYSPIKSLYDPLCLNPYYWKAKRLLLENQRRINHESNF